MKTLRILLTLALGLAPWVTFAQKGKSDIPWRHGNLQVSANHRYLQHADGTPFFWLGETGWLMPERLDRDEVGYYLGRCRAAGFNVVQVQTINAVPAINAYGQYSHPHGYDFSTLMPEADAADGVYSYWDHMDFIVNTAARNGIYIGMVCIWGGLVKAGLMNVEEAEAYGTFLARRYKDCPNIIWIIGGDQRGDVKPEVWESLATTIRRHDPGHVMTYHPRGRTCSATFFNDREWLDFNMFQSGHRRYGQRNGDGDYTIAENTEEDSWRYVEASLAMTPMKPVLDGEPSYEGIPQGLHDITAPRWTAADCRRYAYWSVFAGACGHTYGNNSIMQFFRPGVGAAYGATEPWHEALDNPGFNQMQYLKRLMLAFPYLERVPDQSVLVGPNGDRYDRAIATRGSDYLLVYSYTGRPVRVDLTKISGAKKQCWWYVPADGSLTYIGEQKEAADVEFIPDAPYGAGHDRVLIAVDASKQYVQQHLAPAQP